MSAPSPDPRMQSLINRLRPGAVRTVKVTGFDGADVLVQLVDAEGGAAEIGRVPRQETSMRRVEHPSELFEVGQEINAEEIGRWREGQLHLSARACGIPALRDFLLGVERGQVVTGTVSVTKIVPFGVFVRLAPDVVGFLHLSELTDEPVETPDQLVEEGELIAVKVAEVDVPRHRVRLGAVAQPLRICARNAPAKRREVDLETSTRPQTSVIRRGRQGEASGAHECADAVHG